jgi:hypothetical protein
MDQHRRSKSNLGMRSSGGGADEEIALTLKQQLTSRKSELELRNDIVNQEMKSLFKQVNETTTTNTNNPTAIANSDTNNNTITLSVVHGKTTTAITGNSNAALPPLPPNGMATAASNSLIYAKVSTGQQQQQSSKPSNVNLLRNVNDNNNINVNFNNAVFNKNFIPLQHYQQQQQHNESAEMTHDVTLFSNNISTSDVHLSDDLSMLPVIDDKTLLSSLKAKFEMRKYFVRVQFIFFFVYF